MPATDPKLLGKCPFCGSRKRTQTDMRRQATEGADEAQADGPPTFTYRCEGCGRTYEETEPS